MDGCGRVIVVELKALNEGAVEQGSGRCAGRATPADDRFTPVAFELEYGLDRDTRPWQLSTDERAANAIEEEILGSFEYGGRDVVGPKATDPGRQALGVCVLGYRCHRE
jgi:hypothetical protein